MLTDEEIQRFVEERQKFAPIVERILSPKDQWERFTALREFYAAYDTRDYSPYPWHLDWSQVFTPIEFDVWCDIRCTGLPMWPQYPARRYFLDFADPYKQVAIECDGKDWHDPERDAKRDSELAEDGWHVIRVSGRDCKRCWEPEWDEVGHRIKEYEEDIPTPDVRRWLEETSEGAVAAIGVVFYGHSTNYYRIGDAIRALDRRMLAGVSVESALHIAHLEFS